ncbi:Short-chain dehydrogenase [Psilocybe cubensis]|uniref:Uncharacterized protein n=2 Tax=Psilocybe cubensis TaxID=181762 RepID=A0A8H8CID8_PSICU|nr:Short-chain dehydrogenase [Psilocybe cubensis]KAH9479100.1 Short-chain dehydrogenase [Psilocybe cubensis]
MLALLSRNLYRQSAQHFPGAPHAARFSSHSTGASLRVLPSLNKTAVITGSSRGIGRAIALRLAHDGYDVALNDLPSSSSLVQELGEEIIRNTGRQAIVLTGDVSVEGDIIKLVDDVVEKLGGIDVMIANAGICFTKTIADTTTQEWDRINAINGRGTFLAYKYAAQQMIKQGRGGRIVGASSIAGKQGWPYLSGYCATKFVVRSLTQSAAQEWAKYGITVNAYAPGPIETDMLKVISNVDPNAGVEATAPTTALGVNGTPEDIAGLVSYLVSDQGKFITGQAINIDGGVIYH